MGIQSTHPLYVQFLTEWQTQRDLYRGERFIKDKGEEYLPAMPSMHIDGMKKGELGYKNYQAYKTRAHFPDYIREAVEAYVGMIHLKDSVFELPPEMEPLLEKATLTGEGLQDLLRQITVEQLISGRVGLLADLPEQADQANPLPYIAMYIAESIINWDDAEALDNRISLNLVVLDESTLKRNDEFEWKLFKKFRVLQLGVLAEDELKGAYSVGLFTSDNELTYNTDLMKVPTIRGAAAEEIPFVFINTKDLFPHPDLPPTSGLGRLVLAIYRGDADYRHSLFLTGQDTLVVTGGVRNPDGTAETEGDAVRVGAGSRIDVDIGGDAKYIGVNSQGLSEQRQALENDRNRAEQLAGKLIPASNQKESGVALKTRVTSQTASMTQIAMTAAKGLETLLRKVAVWMGKDPSTVKVSPNLEFGDIDMETKDFQALMAARVQGLPLSKKSIHNVLKQRHLTDMEFDDEMEQIKEEDAEMPPPVPGLLAPAKPGQNQNQNPNPKSNLNNNG